MKGVAPFLLCLAGVLAGSAPALAQDDPVSDADDQIVVTGKLMTREQAVEYLRQVGVARGVQPAARWIDPVCLRVRGIADPYVEIVEARMRATAKEAGIRLARKGCSPNVLVSFVGDARALMHEIDRKASTRLKEVPVENRKALVEGEAPIRWWYQTGTRSRYGNGETPHTIGLEGPGNPPPMQVDAIGQYSSSIVSTQVNRAIQVAEVVIDLNRSEGFRLEAVADYAAFVAFAEVRASESPPSGSILSLFGTDGSPRGLAERDKQFLRALYRLPLDRPANRHRSLLVRAMADRPSGD